MIINEDKRYQKSILRQISVQLQIEFKFISMMVLQQMRLKLNIQLAIKEEEKKVFQF
jgi:hypothetical protein